MTTTELPILDHFPALQRHRSRLGLDMRALTLRPRWRWRWRVLFIGVVLAGTGLVARIMVVPAAPPEWSVTALEQGDFAVTVTAGGTLRPAARVEVGAEISGTIATVDVDFNDRVKAGQIVATLDKSQLETRVRQSRAELDQANAALDETRAGLVQRQAEFSRVSALASKDFASRQSYDQAAADMARSRAQVHVAEARVALADATLDDSLVTLGKTVIRAPIDGVVLDRLVEPGQTVQSSFQIPHFITLAGSLDRMQVIAQIDEASIGQVAPGQKAMLSVDAYPRRHFAAVITKIHNQAKRNNDLAMYDAVLTVENPDLALKPGMTATVEITVDTVADGLILPTKALRFTPPGMAGTAARRDDDLRVVWVPNDKGQPMPVQVEIGRSNGDLTEILKSGLAVGTKVIVGLPADPSPGS